MFAASPSSIQSASMNRSIVAALPVLIDALAQVRSDSPLPYSSVSFCAATTFL